MIILKLLSLVLSRIKTLDNLEQNDIFQQSEKSQIIPREVTWNI